MLDGELKSSRCFEQVETEQIEMNEPSTESPVFKIDSRIAVAICLLLSGTLLTAVSFPLYHSFKESERRLQCSNHARHIGLGLLSYQDTFKEFPPAYTTDSNSKRLHSWRSLIVPFLEKNNFFDKLRQNEPWDSDYNRELSNHIVSWPYQCPSEPRNAVSKYFTNYMVITGPGTIFDGKTQCKLDSITDGAANTILAVEVTGMNVHWMEPCDLDIEDFVNSTGGPGGAGSKHHPQGFWVVMADGSTRFLRNDLIP